MIQNKDDLIRYLNADFHNLDYKYKKFLPMFGKEVLKYQKSLRKYEYYHNISGGGKKRGLFYAFWKWRYHNLGIKLNFDIPINTFDEGLNIHHYGLIVVNANARIGKNCSIQQGVIIGVSGKSSGVPVIGDNVNIGAGAKILGNIVIPSNTVIGANAVVVKSYEEEGLTLVGVPAKPINK